MSYAMSLSEREAGDILRRVINLEEDVKELRGEVRGVGGKVDGILTQIAQVQGGMRVAIWFSGIIGALAMFGLTKVAPLLLGALPRL